MRYFLLTLVVQGHEGAPATPFRLDPGLIIWTWVVFIALLFLLSKFAFPAILRIAEERERRIARQLKEAEDANAQAAAALEEHRQLLAGAKHEASQLVSEAKLVGEKEREAILARAREEQEELLARAKREIDAERDRAVSELRKEAVDLSLAAASRLVESNLDDAANRKMVEDFLESMGPDR